MTVPSVTAATGVDPDAVVAIDVHVHVEQDSRGCFALDQELLDASAAYFKSSEHRTPTLEHIADYYRQRRMAAVVFTVDAHTATGHPALSSEEIADLAAAHRDVLIPFGSVDPNDGPAAVERARRLVTDHGVRGFKFHPSLQAFEPNDRVHYPLYEALQELGAVALFHTGQTGIGAGLPGGRGIKLRYSAPMLIDDVAADFPAPDDRDGPSVGAVAGRGHLDRHPQGERLHRPFRLVTDLLSPAVGSGREQLPSAQGAVRLGLPRPDPGPMAGRLRRIGHQAPVKPLILKDNAARILGLSP